MSRRYSSSSSPFIYIIAGVILLFVLTTIGTFVYSSTQTDVKRGCVVNDKDRTTNRSSGKSDMRVYTDNCGVFNVSDSILSGTWHSSDTFNKIKVGQTYDFTTRGIRVPFFSRFPNITEAKLAG